MVSERGCGDMKLTAKQEGFVLSILEGKSQIDAYKANYNCEKMSDKAIYVNASKLTKQTNIALRLEELRNQQASASKWTLERLIDEFATNHEMARGAKDVRASNDSMKEIGKLLGHYEEKIKHSGEVNTNNPLKDLTAAELKKLINK
jgi:hypothetical protein